MKLFINMMHGFAMALADSVPGVSGGTIAFLLGFYDRFITSLDDLLLGSMDKKKDAFIYLVKLGLGWSIGFIASVLVLANTFEKHIYDISSLFLGFIVLAIPVVIKEEKETLKGQSKSIPFLFLGMLVVMAITFLNPVGGGIDIRMEALTIPLVLYVFVVAMIAISAMVLPGISGSTLLLVFGLYMPIISAIKEFLHFDFSYFFILCVFGLGMIAGIMTTVKLIRKALENYRSQTIYCIIGLMLGSLYSIIMGPTTLEVPQDPMSISTFSVVFFVIGGLIIFGMQKLKEKKED